ncbi:hypothetical protein C900_03556 [Fulvivirga imtechensis AK7]|uniref:DUF4920 domain-containing protein n=1 Tax=Fulvivirga imtechensis AK7 TaxID=1237149 RepID=L8JP09_9BACT|nr:hypothetical protein C900_03556 [Fulvivirga imtechensis AK7]
MSLILGACNNNQNVTEKISETEEVAVEQPVEEEMRVTGSFGEEITEEGVISTEEMLAQLERADSVKVKVNSEILATCKMKGCWMNVDIPGEDNMRVTFKDYGFFVPKDGAEGKNVVMEGYAKKVTTDIETLKHFAKDAGKSQEEIDAITEPKDEVTFVATGVIIKDSE